MHFELYLCIDDFFFSFSLALAIDVHRDYNLEIDQLTQEIEKHEHLMEDTAYSEQLRMLVALNNFLFVLLKSLTKLFYYQRHTKSAATIVNHQASNKVEINENRYG